MISGKPRRRKATADRPCLPHRAPAERRRRAGQPSFLGGTRRYLPAHSGAPQPTRTRTRVRGRARGGADAFRLPTAIACPGSTNVLRDHRRHGRAEGGEVQTGRDTTGSFLTPPRAGRDTRERSVTA